MKSFGKLFLVISTLASIVQGEESWISKHIPSPMEYTVYNEVSIVHNTKLNFLDFWKELQDLAKEKDFSGD